MTSVVRIKRRASQEPTEALLLATKRVRVDESGTPSQVNAGETSVFKFCGSSQNEKENVETIAKLVEKGKLLSHRQPLKASRTVQSKKQTQQKENGSEKKYKVLNTLRNITSTHSDLKIYDLVLESEVAHLEPQIPTCNGVPLVIEKNEAIKTDVEDKYVYDFYYSDLGTFDDSYIDKLMSVQPYNLDLEYQRDSDDDSDDSEDSNHENNFRNDYPDSSEGDSDCDADIVGKMCGMYLDNDDKLSSDDEDFIYSKDDDDPRQGDAYLKYKKRVMKELDGSDSRSSTDSSSDDLEGYD